MFSNIFVITEFIQQKYSKTLVEELGTTKGGLSNSRGLNLKYMKEIQFLIRISNFSTASCFEIQFKIQYLSLYYSTAHL